MAGIPDLNARDREGLSRIFRHYAEVETPPMDSPTYTAICFGVADDPDVLDLCMQINPGQPAPNILLAAVQDLLLEDPERSPESRALGPFYPAVSGGAIPDRSPWDDFRRFCLAHADELGPNLRDGRTQTCVVHRCTALLPALAALPHVEASNGRVGLLEIGPSAGLNLRLDRYRYAYSNGSEWGGPETRPVLRCETRGDEAPPLPARLDVVARRGLDLNPVDLDDPRALRWMRALIWPEHAERARVMSEACEHAASVPIEVQAGDATRDVAEQIAKLPDSAPRVLFATHVLYQIPADGIRRMLDEMAAASRDMPVDFISMEGSGEGYARVQWFGFEKGERTTRRMLARADPHGRWIEWGAD